VTIHRWRGSIAEMSVAADDMTARDSYTGVGGTFPLHSRADYEAAFVAAGLLAPEQSLADQPELSAIAQAHWHASGANACTFAAYMSEHRDEFGWDSYVIDEEEPLRTSALAATIAAVVRPSIEDPEVEVVSVLLPQIEDEQPLAALLARLSGMVEWEVREEGRDDEQALGQMVRLGVRVAVEFDHWSEVLGFGRFATQPNTRLAPFTELAIRAKGPQRPRRDHRSYMADISTGLDNLEFGRWWHDTKEQRAGRLSESQTFRGKAKATFSIKEDTWMEVS
jgi:hypothetical protein